MKETISALIAVAIFLVLPVTGQATIIDINARNNNTQNPVVVFFEAGTYDLQPIGVEDGGAYNAFSFHNGDDGSWRWQYSLSSSELGTIDVHWLGPEGYFETEMIAFANAVSYSFTLTTGADISFYIYDGPGGYAWSGDNTGGLSLYVNPHSPSVPEPATMLLIGTGLLGLVGLRRKFRN